MKQDHDSVVTSAKKKSIVVILGHPARKRISFCEALANAYVAGAKDAGHRVNLVKLSDLEFDPILHEGFQGIQNLETDIQKAQDLMLEASHWVIVYPLWQFMIPALLKGFLERVLTKKFAFDLYDSHVKARDAIKGKTARIIQTMGMPNFAYRWVCRSHGAKALKNVLYFIGIHPVEITYCGQAENPNERRRQSYLKKAHKYGRLGI